MSISQIFYVMARIQSSEVIAANQEICRNMKCSKADQLFELHTNSWSLSSSVVARVIAYLRKRYDLPAKPIIALPCHVLYISQIPECIPTITYHFIYAMGSYGIMDPSGHIFLFCREILWDHGSSSFFRCEILQNHGSHTNFCHWIQWDPTSHVGSCRGILKISDPSLGSYKHVCWW